ncbi:MAG: septal ring lytic transglycosylase RlpA family protein [Acidobacteriaceae bacterium]
MGTILGMLLLCVAMAGCRHRRVQAPPPPAPPAEMEQPAPQPYAETIPRSRGKVLYSEVGIASWYGAPYHNARGADGRIYNQNAMTAAHRTLPLGSVVRVTNLATRQSTIVTITDRGPFVRGRILDLSRAAAVRIGVWRSGTARVRIDLLSSPRPFPSEGRWCVQIGAFHHEGSAKKLRNRLQREYPGANVIDFKGATGYWVRIKPDGESHSDAEEIARVVVPQEGNAYVVRLD